MAFGTLLPAPSLDLKFSGFRYRLPTDEFHIIRQRHLAVTQSFDGNGFHKLLFLEYLELFFGWLDTQGDLLASQCFADVITIASNLDRAIGIDASFVQAFGGSKQPPVWVNPLR